jgi:hypothetical protein
MLYAFCGDLMKGFKYYKELTVGVVSFVLGCGGLYKLERKNYEDVVQEHNAPLMRAAFFGDSGAISSERDQFIRLLDSLDPERIFMLGDQEYPTGIRTLKGFTDHVVSPFYRPGRNVDMAGGNHDGYERQNRDFLIEIGRFGEYPWFGYDHYYKGQIWSNVCIFTADTAVYDSWFPLPQNSIWKRIWGRITGEETIVDRQEKHAKMFFADDRCRYKSRIWAGHHPIYSSGGGHGDRAEEFDVGKDRLWRFYQEQLKGTVDWYIAAHDHVTSRELCEEGTCHFVVGYTTNKTPECARGLNQNCYEQVGLAWWDGESVDLVVGGL